MAANPLLIGVLSPPAFSRSVYIPRLLPHNGILCSRRCHRVAGNGSGWSGCAVLAAQL